LFRVSLVHTLVSDYLLGDIVVDVSEGYYYTACINRPSDSDSSGIYKARLDGTAKSPVLLLSTSDSYVLSMSFNWAAGEFQSRGLILVQ